MSLSRFAVALALAVAVALPGFSLASAHSLQGVPQAIHLVSSVATTCTSTGYSHNCGGCITTSSSGNYSVKVPHTTKTVVGKGASSGSTVCFAKVATPIKSRGGIGLRVTSTGAMGAVKVKGKHVKIYLYSPATKSLKKVKKISKPGIYQIVS
jgi:hypothetical protein